MSSRSEKRREKQPTYQTPTTPWGAVDVTEWLLRCSILLLIMALPWYYGSVQWKSQYILAWVGVFFCAAITLHCIVSVVVKAGDLSIPWLTWLFFILGFVGYIQSLSIFSWQGNEMSPPSVQVQRWALGLSQPPQSFQSTLIATTKATSPESTTIPCDLKIVPESERKLAWSIEPLHTRGAVASLLLCGLFVWVGRMVFSDPKKQIWLFGTMTAIGILIACVGIQGSVSYRSENFLGLRSGSSFATFVSKNSAGGFYNICIAGCLGMLGWTLLNTQRTSKDNRYRFPDTNVFSKIRGMAEDSLADLNTAQITVVLCLVSMVAALLISLCRGAAVSALGAIIIASLIANAKNRSRGTWVMSVAIATAFVACMVGFQIDDKVYARLESLSEIDLESELREGRAYIWSIAWKAMTFYGWLGSGLGTFHFAYLPFQEPSSQGWYYHAESLYAQCGVELGFIGVSALLLAVILLIMGLQRPVANENWGIAFPSKLAGVYLVISQSLHSFVDFAIILPALFVPAAVLIGSVLGALRKAEIAPVRKRSRSDASNPVPRVVRKDVPWLWKGFVGVLIAAGCGLAIADSTKSLESLSISESMDAWTKSEEAKPQELQSPNRVQEMAKIWASHNASLKENSTAMRAFADSLIFDYRMNQLVNSTASSAKTWTETSPVFLQLVLNQELNQLKKEQMIDSVGGQQAVSLLERSSKWYALGQAKSPLDGRLLWGRCFSNTICDRNEIAKLLPASITIAKQNSQQLLATTILFRDLFDETQMERVLEQAMKSDPASSLNAAKVIAAERDDNEVPIKIFPQRFEILQMLATEKDTFTKDRFPQTYRLLWDRARELIAHAPVTNARREIWLADSSIAIGNLSEEIAHLTKAVTYESSNAKLHFRLANRLIDAGDLQGVKKIVEKLKHFDSSSVELKAIEARIANIDRFQSIPAPHE